MRGCYLDIGIFSTLNDSVEKKYMAKAGLPQARKWLGNKFKSRENSENFN